ncbi:hypothetical protein Y900_005115 [Mycolicibacterium aromaticivorans JS19b1 = JCM 16368]|uniref:Uncharacterized protein n=1 Tax=Mycolicibacterium aromaticivorans JS19b1 = JCM 16368 TaxID=1440774 RepID=A0A064CFA3_9MYCO|nr:hypothetical protein [Mycolicibacterium aromaticivorans]KDE98336.1 hypothetical protein Y900_005115 [Mycolicibacterium aromaticivorans JS19b1 = JCM 16368]
MFVAASPAEAIAVLRAMRTVASADNTLPLSAADARGISSAFNTVFGQPDDVDVDALPTITPTELGDILSSEGLRLNAIRMLSVMALNDGVIEDAKLALVGRYASALDVRADFVAAMAALLANDIAWAAFDQIRHNVATIPGMPWIPDDPYGPFLPYGGDRADPQLRARYDALRDFPAGSLGRAFFEHYRDNGYAFPGDPRALNETWATPHDSLHVLSGYSTSAQGELLVAAFTGAAKRGNTDLMESHIIPTILIYHMGIDINKGLNAGDHDRIAADPSWRDNYQGNVHLGLDLAKLWVAWDRGVATTEDLYSGHWDLWSVATEQVVDLRLRYGIPRLDAADAAVIDDDVRRGDYERPGMPPPPQVSDVAIDDRPHLDE